MFPGHVQSDALMPFDGFPRVDVSSLWCRLCYGHEMWSNRRIIKVSAISFMVHKQAEEKLLVF